jgi:hypothetical protein
MNLSISNSELKVIAAVALVFGAVELGIRGIEDDLSIDVKHIHAIPSIVASLDRQSVPHMVFLGNSLTRVSIQPETIAEGWPAAPSMARIYPDDTTLLDWHYVYQRYLDKLKPGPNLIVVSFVRSQLDDSQELHMDRLGSHFAGFQFVSEVFEYDVRRLGDRIEFILAGAFRVMANRERVQSRVLASIPGYKELADVVNHRVRTKANQSASQFGVPTYTRLHRFLKAAHTRGDKVLFVAIPVPRPYKVSIELRDAIQRGGATLIDMQGVEPFTDQDFPDGYHLSEEAAPRFSRALGRTMADNEFVQTALYGKVEH